MNLAAQGAPDGRRRGDGGGARGVPGGRLVRPADRGAGRGGRGGAGRSGGRARRGHRPPPGRGGRRPRAGWRWTRPSTPPAGPRGPTRACPRWWPTRGGGCRCGRPLRPWSLVVFAPRARRRDRARAGPRRHAGRGRAAAGATWPSWPSRWGCWPWTRTSEERLRDALEPHAGAGRQPRRAVADGAGPRRRGPRWRPWDRRRATPTRTSWRAGWRAPRAGRGDRRGHALALAGGA